MRSFVHVLLGLACLASAALALMLLYPVQVRLTDQRNVFVIWHDHVTSDVLAHFLRIAVPMGAVVLCVIALVLFWKRNPGAPLGLAKQEKLRITAMLAKVRR
jgi:hypothetical protein